MSGQRAERPALVRRQLTLYSKMLRGARWVMDEKAGEKTEKCEGI